jgi:menaquinol-cytochrome c reductase iron-sulfur subunit
MRMESSSRRKFVTASFGIVCAAGAAIVGVPSVAVFLAPAKKKTVTGATDSTADVDLDDLAVNEPRRLDIVGSGLDAWDRTDPHPIGAAWLVRRGDGRVQAYSATCPHLGCSLGYDARRRLFTCPCHDSAFSLADGARLVGPAPRGMDPLPVRVAGGKVSVIFKRFILGIPARRET